MQARRYNTDKPRLSLINDTAELSVESCDSFINSAKAALTEFKSVSSNTTECLRRAVVNLNLQYCEDNGYIAGTCGIHPTLEKDLGFVYGMGAKKYSDVAEDGTVIYDGTFNWRLGMSWLSVLDSALRHINSYKSGEVTDGESNHYHLTHALWNVYALIEFSKSCPQYDDRYTPSIPRIGLDIDGVIADFEKAFVERFAYPGYHVTSWNDPLFRDNFSKVHDDEKFWLELPLIEELIHKPLGFNPVGYVTARPIDDSVTMKYLFEIHRLPKAPLINVGVHGTKLEACKELNIELFVDDAYHNYVDLNKGGVTCLLKTRPHNTCFNVGSRRIDSIHNLEKIWS